MKKLILFFVIIVGLTILNFNIGTNYGDNLKTSFLLIKSNTALAIGEGGENCYCTNQGSYDYNYEGCTHWHERWYECLTGTEESSCIDGSIYWLIDDCLHSSSLLADDREYFNCP